MVHERLTFHEGRRKDSRYVVLSTYYNYYKACVCHEIYLNPHPFLNYLFVLTFFKMNN